MSLVNQVLRDLQHRRGETPDTSGLYAAPVHRAGRRRALFWAGLAGIAVVTGVGLLVIERAVLRGELAPSAELAQPLPTQITALEPEMRAVAEVVAEVAPEPEPITVAVVERPPVELAGGPAAPLEAAPTVEAPVPTQTETQHVVAAAQPAPRDDGVLQRTLVIESPQQRAADAYTSGVRALSEGRRGTAESQFRSALGHDAAHHEARLALANVLAADGRLREAEAQLQEGLRLAPHQWTLADRHARMLFDRGDLSGAIGVLVNAPPPVEEATDYHALLAALLQRAGRHETAAATYQALVTVRPEQGLWWMGLGISLESVGRPDAAADAYARSAHDPRLSSEVARFVHERLAVLDQRPDR